MRAFEEAWNFLKAHPMAQELIRHRRGTPFTEAELRLPQVYDSYDGTGYSAFGTIHPQARSMAHRASAQVKTPKYLGPTRIERMPRQGDLGAESEEARRDEERPITNLPNRPVKYDDDFVNIVEHETTLDPNNPNFGLGTTMGLMDIYNDNHRYIK